MPELLTALLSAIIGYFVAIQVERSKLKNRLRLENEYQILMRLWEKGYWVKSSANNLRPEHGPQAATLEEKQERLDDFAKKKEEFVKEMYLKKPFYPQVFHEVLEELKLETHMEAFDYNLSDPSEGAKYWDKASQNAETINGIVDRLCSAIRHHINHG